jgi:hypothetical protein
MTQVVWTPMRFLAHIQREDLWPVPERASQGEPITIEVTPDTPFGDAVDQALSAAGRQVRRLYDRWARLEGGYSPLLLRDSNDPDSELVPFPRVAIAEDGEFIWVWGARDRATLADYERARAAGYTEVDPYAVFLWRPQGGNGIIPTWLDLLRWLEEAAFVGAAVWFADFIRRHLARWESRGATVPNAFLDIFVVSRPQWDRAELARSLGISDEEAAKMLSTLGYEPIDPVGRTRWVPSKDSDAAALRRKILSDFMHRFEGEE